MTGDDQAAHAVLTLDEFTAVLLEGAELWWLRDRADALLEAAVVLTREQQPIRREHFETVRSREPLASTIRRIVHAMRADINPFSGMLEAPRAVADLYQKHADAVKQAETTRSRALNPLLRDAASAWFHCLTAPIMWDDLIQRGVPRHPPAPPEPSDFDL